MPDYQQWLVRTFGGLFMKTLEQGAATTCYVAGVKRGNGAFLCGQQSLVPGRVYGG